MGTYILYIGGADQIVWGKTLFRAKLPSLYVEARVDGEVRRTKVVKKCMTPFWNEKFILSTKGWTSVLSLAIKHDTSKPLVKDPSLGSIDIELNELWRMCEKAQYAVLELKSSEENKVYGRININLSVDDEASSLTDQVKSVGKGNITVRLSTDAKASTDLKLATHGPASSLSPSIGSSRPRTALNAFKFSLITLRAVGDGVCCAPGLKTVCDMILTVIENVQQGSENEQGFSDLADRIKRLQPMFLSVQDLEENLSLVPILDNLKDELENLGFAIQKASMQSKIARFFNSTDDANSLASHIAILDTIIAEFGVAVSVDTHRVVSQVHDEMKLFGAVVLSAVHSERFNCLKRVEEAPYNSSAREVTGGCLAGTRIGILEKIHEWIKTPGTLIFWLNGAAGTGKSTIAHSIAEAYDCKEAFGASFFFSRDQQTRRETKYLFQTLAFQFGNAWPPLKLEIAKELEDQSILTSNLQRQLRRLLLNPISRVKAPWPFVVVLDALDECEDEDDVTRVIKLLAAELKDRSLPLKFFLTSRPETHLRSTFRFPEVYSRTCPFVLHSIKASDVRLDIKSFIKYEMRQIANCCHEILEHVVWPAEHEIEALVDISAELFVAAATALKFITPVRGSRDPRARLRILLDSSKKKPSLAKSQTFLNLDAMYTQILMHSTAGQPPEAFVHFRTVVGAIVLSYGRLSVHELGVLLQMEDHVRPVLAELQSVILVPEGDAPIQTLHLSFHDYLTDKNRCTNEDFFVDAPKHHAQIARFCLERMKEALKRDICNIADYTKMNNEVDDLDKRKADYIPGDLRYACRYWAQHLREASPVGPLLGLIQSFTFSSILHWIEVLSLIGELGGGLTSLREAQQKLSLEHAPPQALLVLLRDAERFLFDFYDGISMSALHIYYSALPFSPKGTMLYKTFAYELKEAPKLIRGVSDNWNACLRTMEGHSDRVLSVSVSHNGSHVVSGSSDKTARIWDAHTGETLHQLDGHSSSIRSVAISPDGTRVVSGCDDNIVRVWDGLTGVLLRELRGHAFPIRGVTISHDGGLVLSGSDDTTIRIWKTQTGALERELRGHSRSVVPLAISQDGTRIASGSDDKTVRIWDARTGASLHELKGHTFWVISVVISHDGSRVISASYDQTIRIWDIWTGELVLLYKGHLTPVRSVAISYDDSRVVAGFDDQSIRIWDIHTGEDLHELRGHSSSVWSVAISDDGTRVISGSYDGTIRIWDAQAVPPLREQDGHSSSVLAVAISHDGTRVVSGSYDDTVCIWDAQTGKALHKLEGHASSVLSVAISRDGNHVVSGSDDETVRIWNAHTGMVLHELKGHSNWVRAVVISNDGTRVVSGAYDTTIRIWDMHTGAAVHELTGHTGSVRSVAISYDGTRIISGSSDKRILIWDAQTGMVLQELVGHLSAVKSIAISHDGSRVISGSYDQTIRIWDTQNGRPFHHFDIADQTVMPDVSFGPHEACIMNHGHSFPIPSHARPLSSSGVHRRHMFGAQGGWVFREGKRCCWIPLAYRGVDAISPPLIVFGTPGGEIVILSMS